MFQQSLLFLLLLGNFQYFQSAAFIWCYCFPFMKKINSGDLIKIDLKTQASNCKYQAIWNLAFLGWCHLLIWRRQWHPTPVLVPGKSHRRRSLVGCSPWGHEESDTTEWLNFHFSLSCTGAGNGNPLQYSCLENPRDGGDWWAAVSGVAQESDTTEATWQQ